MVTLSGESDMVLSAIE